LQRIQSGYFHSRYATGEVSAGRHEEKLKSPEGVEREVPVDAVEVRLVEGAVHVRTATPGLIAPLPAGGDDEDEREPSLAVSLQEELVAAVDVDAAKLMAGDTADAAPACAERGGERGAESLRTDGSAVNAAILQTHARLRACLAELHDVAARGGPSGNGGALLAAESVPEFAEDLTAEQALSAAIRASHELTGILLEQWNKSHSPR
jgi:hypothetical protein